MSQSHYEVGSGSWYINQVKTDYPGMSVRDFQKITYAICKDRITLLRLKKGDMITLVFISGRKQRKYTGVYISCDNGVIELQQRNRVASFDIRFIDEIETIEIVGKWKM